MRLRTSELALVCYSVLLTGISLALLFTVITDKDTPPPSSYNLSECSLPAVSRFDLRPAEGAPNQTPCQALPAGLILACDDGHPYASVLDCEQIQALIVR